MTSWTSLTAGFERAAPRTLWYAGNRQSAVLVHGDWATPAALRPLAEALHRAGWTVRAPRRPGWTRQAWVAAVRAEWRQLAEFHTPLLLVGYEAGVEIALQVAAEEPIPALALLATTARCSEARQPTLVVPGRAGDEAVLQALLRFAWDAWEPVSGLHLPQLG
jgi:esterase/lipase